MGRGVQGRNRSVVNATTVVPWVRDPIPICERSSPLEICRYTLRTLGGGLPAALDHHNSPAYQEALKVLGDGAVRDVRVVEGLE